MAIQRAGYPVLKRFIILRISKGRLLIKNIHTNDSEPVEQDILSLLGLCNGTVSIADIIGMYAAGSGSSAQTAGLFVESVLAHYDGLIEYQNTSSALRNFRLDYLTDRRIAPWTFSPLREETIYSLSISPSHRCNHHCGYCFQGCESIQHAYVNLDTWLKVINEAGSIGVQELTISGGEPLLYENLLDLIRTAVSWDIYVKISTNGALFTEELIKRIKDAGVDYIHLSLPSVDEDRYNMMTGSRGNLSKVKRAIALLKRNGFFIRVKMVLTAENTDSIGTLIDYCADNGVDSVHLAPFILTGQSRGGQELIPAEADLRRVVQTVQEKSLVYPTMRIIEPPLDALHWADETQIVACGGVKEDLTIMPNGDITFCEPLGNIGAFVFGNITNNTLYEIWNSGIPDFINGIPKDKLDDACGKCTHLDVCHTGCFLFSYRDFNNPFAIDPRCFRSKGLEPAV